MPASAPVKNNTPRTELQELQELKHKAEQVTDESLESTRRIVTLCEESQEVGVKTLVMLDDIGEKLDNIEDGMDQIKTDMKEAAKNLTEMGKCCGLCILPCLKGSSDKDVEGTWKGNEDGKVVTHQPQRIPVADRNGTEPQDGYIHHITNDAREDEMEQNIGQVNRIVGNLRNIAIDISSELQSGNDQIDRIIAKGASNEARIGDANQRAHDLLK